jgi:hypothetical protein
MPPLVPTLREPGVDAIVVYHPAAPVGQRYKTYVVDAGLYSSATSDDAAVVIRDAFMKVENRGVVGFYQQLDFLSGVSIPFNCAVRGLSQSNLIDPGCTPASLREA